MSNDALHININGKTAHISEVFKEAFKMGLTAKRELSENEIQVIFEYWLKEKFGIK